MTKKLLSVMMAATMLFATSCQQDEVLAPNNGEEALVQVNLSTPQIATRAYSDGQTATHLQYAVYEKVNGEWVELPALTKTQETINLKKTVNLKLTTGNEYTLVFWAAAPNAPYTIDFGAKTMTVDYTKVKGNDENRDAFINDTTIIVNGNANLDIHLRRPFAQLNIGTSDLEASKNAGYEVVSVSMTKGERGFLFTQLSTLFRVKLLAKLLSPMIGLSFPKVRNSPLKVTTTWQ